VQIATALLAGNKARASGDSFNFFALLVESREASLTFFLFVLSNNGEVRWRSYLTDSSHVNLAECDSADPRNSEKIVSTLIRGLKRRRYKRFPFADFFTPRHLVLSHFFFTVQREKCEIGNNLNSEFYRVPVVDTRHVFGIW